MITPPLPPDALARFPGLERFGRTATRLHPRPGPVTAAESHVGGPLRWPADEPWPTCDAPHMVHEEVPLPAELVARMRAAERGRTQPHVLAEGEVELHREIARLVGPGLVGWGSRDGGPVVGHRYVPRPHPTPNPMVALAQLHARDVPDLPRPGGADLLQVLWCPFEHSAGPWGPTVQLRWRREADLTDLLGQPPRGEVGNDGYVPEPCRLHPEQVVEYPYPEDLPEDLRTLIDETDEADGYDDGSYVDTFMAPGWKVGGYADWSLTDLRPTPCPRCAGPTTLTLVVDSSERGTGRWRPTPADGEPDDDPYEPTGVVVGRHGALRIFVCLSCPDVPFLLDQQ
ncbi:hypothetical protein AB0I85_01075 [Micromonospora echinofusca]|uniref:hypothetical protein n=1 Tax=Micromonospora echinofusca TaxID=47858 RepID=UPI000CAA6F6C|nr:hypothetical protein [Micromonospora sp. MSM11]MCL7460053.1 hypothetical protein [Micromonospora sp. MSM11]